MFFFVSNLHIGRGAAMIIESLLLFYHINCFKCCVCHVQLGDGLNGTDVRVRNHKLHCQNCYSSDDGIKFSCV
ncbi:GH19502 [Drosophila grimshawi]|uniref:GH19502 n=1 Tax=Drosophila grimshawi TaxID=7222 RepID=B4JGX3_DROGR|nr:GH19502 [Drosophila grimshawi]